MWPPPYPGLKRRTKSLVNNSEQARAAQRKGQANRQPPEGKHWCARCSRRYANNGVLHCKLCQQELASCP